MVYWVSNGIIWRVRPFWKLVNLNYFSWLIKFSERISFWICPFLLFPEINHLQDLQTNNFPVAVMSFKTSLLNQALKVQEPFTEVKAQENRKFFFLLPERFQYDFFLNFKFEKAVLWRKPLNVSRKIKTLFWFWIWLSRTVRKGDKK